MARPRTHNRRKVLEAFDTYIDATDIPIVAEFATLQKLSREFLYSNEEFADAISRCTFKKEAALERHALTGRVNTTMAIFSLKQLGWTDKVDNTHKGDPAAPLVFSTADAKL